MGVPKIMQATYDAMAEILKPYCDEYLNAEYLELCLHAVEKLCRKRPSPLVGGRLHTWAAGIVYAIGQANFIFDPSQPIHLTAEELSAPFGVAKSMAGNKAAEVRKLLKIGRWTSEWMLPSIVEERPFVWFVEYNGMVVDARVLPLDLQIFCAKKGWIPYVPALKDADNQAEKHEDAE